MLESGRQIFRYDTFGSEAFWGDALQLHKAIAGEKNGGVGGGVSPKIALSVGLKVDLDALPEPLKQQLKEGKVNLDLRQEREHSLDGDSMCVLPFHCGRLASSRDRKAARRLGQPRLERWRDRFPGAEPQAVH